MKEHKVKKIWLAFYCLFFFAANAQTAENIQLQNSAALNLEETLSPELPLEYSYLQDVVEITYTKKIKNATLYFRQYNEKSNANAFGTLEAGKKLSAVYGSTVCFWLEYNDGIKSRAKIFYAQKNNREKNNASENTLMQIFSPQSGTWKNAQLLNISVSPNTTVYYSLDGSEPEQSGQIYFKPFVIEKAGRVNLKVKAVSTNGKTEEVEINYAVSPKGAEPSSSFSFLTTLPQQSESIKEKKLPYNILAWNYVEFILQSPIRYEITKQNKVPDSLESVYKKYSGPIFLDRSEDLYIFWSCESFEKGAVQKIFLPAKPKLTVSQNAVSTKPVTLKLSDNRYEYYFSVTDLFTPYEPDLYSHKIENATHTFSVNDGEEFHYNLRIKAFYEGVSQGEFFADFTIDKKKPPKLEPIFSKDKAENAAVIMRLPELPANADYEPIVKISPEVKKQNDGSYILDGENARSTSYRVVAYYEDAAGNRGEVFQTEITVSPFSLYVDSEHGSTNGNDGSSKKPFSHINQAFEFIKNKKNTAHAKKIWTIYVNGNFAIDEPIFVGDKIEIKGNNAVFNFQTNAGFVLENANVNFSGIIFKRTEHEDEPRTVPVIYASNSSMNIYSSQFDINNGGTVISLFYTSALFQNIIISSNQKKYSECFLIKNSEAIIHDVKLTLECNSAVAFHCSDSLCQFTNCNVNITSATACRMLECVRTNAELQNVAAVRLPDVYNTDACIFSDNASQITQNKMIINGFKYEHKR